jgi:hypothetical protein
MTIERKVVVSLEDIKAISFECLGDNCKYRITVSPDDPFNLPSSCQRGHRWIGGQPETMIITPLMTFTKILAQLRVLSTQRALGYKILMEFDEPKV